MLIGLDRNGVALKELGRPTEFRRGAEVLDHRTPWAGVGDGVLSIDSTRQQQAQLVPGKPDPAPTIDNHKLKSLLESARKRLWDENVKGNKEMRNLLAMCIARRPSRSSIPNVPTQRKVRPEGGLVWVFSRRIWVVCAACIFGTPSFAREVQYSTYFDLPNAGELVASVEEGCSVRDRLDIKKRLGMEEVVSEVIGNPHEFGFVSRFGVTIQTFFLARPPGDLLLLQVSTSTGSSSSRICDRILVLRKPSGAVRIRPAFKGGSAIDRLTDEQRAYIQRTLDRCRSMGSSARRNFSEGDFDVDEQTGDPIGSLGFSCEAAAENSAAAIDVAFGARTIRVTAIFDRIYVSEVAKR